MATCNECRHLTCVVIGSHIVRQIGGVWYRHCCRMGALVSQDGPPCNEFVAREDSNPEEGRRCKMTPCLNVKTPTGNAIICFNKIYAYEFNGIKYIFENTKIGGPQRLKKDLEPAQSQPGPRSKFWKMYDEFAALSPGEKEKCEQ